MLARLRHPITMALLGTLAFTANSARGADLLPSWSDGPARKSIVDFVTKVTTAASATFVPVLERIAVFENDGTLWCEQPLPVQLYFAIDRVKVLAPQDPEWKTQEPFASLLKGDVKAGLAAGDRAIVDRVYQPMLEVLAYLRANGFKTFIVSGGGIEFMRAWAERAYGIQPERVAGSIKTKFDLCDGKAVPVRLPEVNFDDDKDGKPIGIKEYIGRRPVMALENSSGEQQMVEYTQGGSGARFELLVLHDDAGRGDFRTSSWGTYHPCSTSMQRRLAGPLSA